MSFSLTDSERAASYAAGILNSLETKKLWDTYHVTSREFSPAELAVELDPAKSDMRKNPQALSFIMALVEIGQGALGSEECGEDQKISILRRDLDRFSRSLAQMASGMDLPAIESLPERQALLLDMLKHKTAQTVLISADIIQNTARATVHEIWQDAKEHPASFTGFLTLSLGTLWFMNRKMGPTATTYIDSDVATITNLSLEALEDENFQVETHPELLNLNQKASCHDHLVQIFGEDIARIVKNTLDSGGLFPQHCSRIKTLALNAQGTFQDGYSWINERLGWFTEDVAVAIGKSMPESGFSSAFLQAAHEAAEKVYAFDAVENIVIHSILFQTSFYAARRLAKFEMGEGGQVYREVGDFLCRSPLTNPLSYAFAMAGSAYFYIANNGFSQESVWAGVGGALTGHFVHKALRYYQRKDYVMKITADMPTVVDEAPLADPAPETAGGGQSSRWKGRGRLGIAFITVSLPAVSVTAEVSGALERISPGSLKSALINVNEVSAQVLANGIVWGNYMLINIPQDMGLHVIFGIAGAGLGMAYGVGEKGLRAFRRSCFPERGLDP